ncbi:MFS transporter [Streptomyces sp. NPDC017529]|uniref:MFS transporter n=1 Tax=Streptomyces sp. NPDC017529 TaxID=3365000 RepID=UPI0037B88020
MPFRLAVLILAIFCVGTAELVPSGMLGDLSEDLSVSIPTAGLLVTVYALTMVVGGPLITALTTRVRRKYLLVGLLALFVAGNVISTFAGNFGVLVAGRMVTAVIHGTFLAVCVVTAGGMVAKEKAGSAVAGMQLGINLATVLGVPLGTLIAQHYNWRVTFGIVAGLAVLAALLILAVIPDDGESSGSAAAHELRVFKKWSVLGTVLATVLCSGGMFTLITFMVPLLTNVGGFPASWVPVVLVAYGVGSILGNLIGGRFANRSIDSAVLWLSWVLAAVCVLFWAAAPFAAGGAVSLFLFSLATFALIPGLQTKVLSAAADAPTLSLTANMSAFGLGAALGSWLGGQIIDLGLGTRSVTLGAAVLTGLGALLITQTVFAARSRRGTGAEAPAPQQSSPSPTGVAQP